MAMVFHATLLSGWALVQGDLLDTRFNLYILEHGYRWLLRAPGHTSFWNAPFYYPAPNVTAYSDTLLTVAPVYWLLRAIGLAPDTALQCWLMVMATLNFAAAYAFLRRAARAGSGAAAAGAFLFAFANARTAQMAHPQMQPQLYTVLALYALVRAIQALDAPDEARAARRWIPVFAAAVAAQFWAGFYYGFFLVLALGIAALWSLPFPEPRAALGALVRRHPGPLGASAALGVLLVAPLAAHYLAVVRVLGLRPYASLSEFIPTPWSWLSLGRDNWVYGAIMRAPAFAARMPREQELGLGLVTTALAAWGLLARRRHPLAALSLATALTIVVIATRVPGGHTLWTYVFLWVPGASALRAVSRIGIMLLLPAAIGVAMFIDHARAREWRTAALVAALAVMLEQGQEPQVYGKSAARAAEARVASLVPSACEAFVYTPRHARRMTWQYQVDGMWAGLERGIPTVNGYSGNAPPGWMLRQIRLDEPGAEARVDAALAAWRARWGSRLPPLCRLTPDLSRVHEPLAHPYGGDAITE